MSEEKEQPGPQERAHEPDGLELAKAVTKSAAGSTPAARARRRAGTPPPSRLRTSGAHPDDRDPQLISDTVERIVDQHGWELNLRVHGIFGRWAELVGDQVAQHTTPESFEDGKLLAPTVVRRLNEELGHGTVTLIEVRGPEGPSWKKGRLSSRDGRGPRDTYG